MTAATISLPINAHEIVTPKRVQTFDAAIGVLATVALIILPLAGSLATGAEIGELHLYWGALEGLVIAIAVGTLLVLSWLTELQIVRGPALVAFVFAGAIAAAPYIAPVLSPTPFNTLYITAPLAFVMLTRLLPGYDRSFGWLRRGRLTSPIG